MQKMAEVTERNLPSTMLEGVDDVVDVTEAYGLMNKRCEGKDKNEEDRTLNM